MMKVRLFETKHSKQMNVVAVFLLGTAGDVHPGISIALHLSHHGLLTGDKGAAGKGNRRNLQLEIHVFTHRDHLQLLTELEQGENPIVFHAIDTDSFQDPNEEDPEHSEQRRKENEGILNGFREMQKRGSVELLVFNLFAYNVW